MSNIPLWFRLQMNGRKVPIINLQTGRDYYYTTVSEPPVKFTYKNEQTANDRKTYGVAIKGKNEKGREVNKVVMNGEGNFYEYEPENIEMNMGGGKRRSSRTRKTRKSGKVSRKNRKSTYRR